MNMDMRVTGVYKALVSAGDVPNRGHEILSSKFGSFASHDPTGQSHPTAYRASPSAPGFWLYNKKDVYTFPFDFVEDSNSQRSQEQACARRSANGLIISSSARSSSARINGSIIIFTIKRACAGGNPGVFSTAHHATVRLEVDDDEEEMDMDGEEGTRGTRQSRRQELRKSRSTR